MLSGNAETLRVFETLVIAKNQLAPCLQSVGGIPSRPCFGSQNMRPARRLCHS